MKNPRIYTCQPLNEQQKIILKESAAVHVGRALRMQAGDPLILFNGEGSSFQAHIVESNKKQVIVAIESELPAEEEQSIPIHIGQALSRGERMDWAVQKATELGVDEITPLFTQRCEVKLNAERSAKRVQHWQQIAISASEQCGRNKVPVIHSPVPVEAWMQSQTATLRLVLHHRTTKSLQSHQRPDSVSLLIGPEGGLTAEELLRAEDLGFHATSLGPRVLRTETAPIAALSLIQYLWGDMRETF